MFSQATRALRLSFLARLRSSLSDLLAAYFLIKSRRRDETRGCPMYARFLDERDYINLIVIYRWQAYELPSSFVFRRFFEVPWINELATLRTFWENSRIVALAGQNWAAIN